MLQAELLLQVPHVRQVERAAAVATALCDTDCHEQVLVCCPRHVLPVAQQPATRQTRRSCDLEAHITRLGRQHLRHAASAADMQGVYCHNGLHRSVQSQSATHLD